MSAVLPVELFPITGHLAFALAWPRLRTQPLNGWLVAEAFGMTLAIAWAAWVTLWWGEQRW